MKFTRLRRFRDRKQTPDREPSREIAENPPVSRATGYIERVDVHALKGWLVGHGAQPEIKLVFDGEIFVPEVTWYQRDDVAEALKCEDRTPGFDALIPRALWVELVQDRAAVERISVQVDGKEIPHSDSIRFQKPDSDRARLPALISKSHEYLLREISADACDLLVRIDQISGFTIYGALQDRSGRGDQWSGASFGLLCGEHELECAVVLGGLADKSSQQVSGKQHGEWVEFEIEIPGYLWERANESGGFPIQVSVCSVALPPTPIRVTIDNAKEWISDVADGYFGGEQYWTLLALEHLHYLGDAIELPEAVVDFFRKKIDLHNLSGYVRLNGGGDEVRAPEGDRTLAIERAVWQSLREFNAALPAWKGREEKLLREILANSELAQDQRHWLIYSLVPFYCRIDQFAAVSEALLASQIEALETADDDWQRSLALPFLVELGAFERVADLIQSIPESRPNWLNTECLAYVSKQIIEIDPGTLDEQVVEKCGYAIINLLDQLGRDFWSRLVDVHLIEALIPWLDAADRWSYWLRRALEAAAIRSYGLCPEFWERVEPSQIRQKGLLWHLAAAEKHFSTVRSILASPNVWTEVLDEFKSAIAFFQRHGNSDAAIFAREFVCSRLGRSMVTDASAIEAAQLEFLIGFDDNEAVRLAAFPARRSEAALTSASVLSDRLVEMGDVSTRAPKYILQQRAGADLLALQKMLASGDGRSLAEILGRLDEAVGELRAVGSKYAGIDILATRLALVCLSGIQEADQLEKFRLLFDEQFNLQATSAWPTMSLIAALSRLKTLAVHSTDAMLAALADDLQRRLETICSENAMSVKAALGTPPNRQLSSDPSSVFGDTLVVVYSCRKYLETRVPVIRETWAAELAERDIPYLILVGDGDDSIEGDVLRLDVSDRYEDLPLKSLKLFDWVRSNTDYQFVIKVDDDCLLDVEKYFGSLSYRKFHYYGRALHRSVGAMDRVWHQSKAQGGRAKRAVDKSPEPSVYADGGTGYALSRIAMQCLAESSKTMAGERLIASSFMEDKLIGDLLRLRGIVVEDEDYYTFVRRRTFGDAVPISMWVNSFYPSVATPIKLVHLDTERDIGSTNEGRKQLDLRPKRIWPTNVSPSLIFNNNGLELLSSVERASAVLQEDLLVIAVVRNEGTMLPHFLDHYRRLGVKGFVFIDNASDDGTRETLLGEHDVLLYSADTEYRYSHYGVSWQKAVLGNHCIGRWVVLADADEFLVYPDYEQRSLRDYVRDIEEAGCDSARVMMIDMYPYGDLSEADFERDSPFEVAAYFDKEPVIEWRIGGGYFGNTRNFTSGLRHRLMPASEPHAFMSQKYALLRYMPWMRLNQGLHNVANIRPIETDLCFAHFKYHAGFKQKVEVEVERKQHFDGAREYKRYLEMVAESGGGFGRKDLSVRFEDGRSFSYALADMNSGAQVE